MDNVFFSSESFSGDNAHGTMPQGFWYDDVRLANQTGTESRVRTWNPAVFNGGGAAAKDVALSGIQGTQAAAFAVGD